MRYSSVLRGSEDRATLRRVGTPYKVILQSKLSDLSVDARRSVSREPAPKVSKLVLLLNKPPLTLSQA